ncbi:MAG TPA: NAD(P)(+) transhydrogenase (Re/Si-specific) subunit beta [Gemmatimonadaceae bacterium]|nr:NAD(P)(+) transhydrogenase (Re/Si-specific) subunit beta [Gemmatimonadaceae bacterium]
MNGAEDTRQLVQLAYLVSAVLFILGLKLLSSPRTARRGNVLGAIGMLLAIAAALFEREVVRFEYIALGVAIGAIVGAWMAVAVKMTAMPQMVALLNGFGGGASALVAAAEFNLLMRRVSDAYAADPSAATIPLDVSVSTMLAMLIGAVTFTGSMVAFAKLQELMTGRAVVFPLQKTVNLTIFLGILALATYLVVSFARPDVAFAHPAIFVAMAVLSLALGVLLVVPIGGADMPVVISLLNSYSGMAGAAAGFVLHNNVLIISGALVGASGIILTQIMCRAMNRSLTNVLFGAFGAQAGTQAIATGDRTVRSVTPEDAAVMLAYARSVIVVPGYGLAVAQAQHTVRELAALLEKRGIDVKYAIHPVAGRMPGHMNVLLAEADVPYTQLFEMDEINREFERTDVALVVGANDVTNPAARTDPSSPLFGMPILNVDQAKSTIVIKRSMAAGFAGIDNPLYYLERTAMLFGDAKKMLTALVTEVSKV